MRNDKPKTFSDVIKEYSWEQVQAAIAASSAADVERALQHPRPGLEEFRALISPAASPYLEQMAQRSLAITRRRFGNVIQLYLPLYLHNYCQNACRYCGFQIGNAMPRRALDEQALLAEAAAIGPMGFEHLLLVSGESAQWGVDYFARCLDLLHPHFAQLSLEVQPLECNEYQLLSEEHGLHAVMIYQETYDEKVYQEQHPKGRKRDFHYRLQTPDRLGQARVHKIGIGSLIGLNDWRCDAFFCKLHLCYLEQRYWRTRYSLSFPRLRPHAGGQPQLDMSDREFVQLICAHRICDPDVELSLSTRERAALRDHILPLGFTTLSAGSITQPGGYAAAGVDLEQFEIGDSRSPAAVAAHIRSLGLDVVWKDWDPCLQGQGSVQSQTGLAHRP